MKLKILKNTHAKHLPLIAGQFLSEEQQQLIPSDMLQELVDAGFISEVSDQGSPLIASEETEHEVIPEDAPDADDHKPKKKKGK